ncbi:hypothetical protein D043_0138A, partial [Vibrio parahaemolyticus EKP-021]
MPLGA